MEYRYRKQLSDLKGGQKECSGNGSKQIRNPIKKIDPEARAKDLPLLALKNKLASKGRALKTKVLKTGLVLPDRIKVKRTPETNEPAASAAHRPPIKTAAGEEETIWPWLAILAKMGKESPTRIAKGPQAKALWKKRSARGISSPAGTWAN